MRNLLTSFLDQRETIGNLLAPFLTGQPQQFAKQPNPNMLLQGAEAAQQPAPPLSAPIEVLQKQVAEVPRAVDPMPTHSTSRAMPSQPPQSKSGGFFDGLSKFGESDFGQRLGDMMLGWGMGSTMQDSLSKGSQMIAAGNQDRKAKKQVNQTVEWLKSQGMSEAEAQATASDRPALNAYLIAMRKGIDPMQALQQRKLEAEIKNLENSPSKFGFTTLPDGTVIRTNEAAGSVEPVFQSGAKPTGTMQEYEAYKADEAAAGRTPLGRLEYEQSLKKAGAGNTNVTVGGEGDAYQKKFWETMGASNAKTFTDAMETGDMARRNRINLDRLSQLATSTPQGFQGAAIKALGEYGIKTDGLDNVQAMESLISQMVPTQRPPGSGTISDADLALYKASLPRLINSPDGNKLIMETMYAINDHDIAASDIAARVAANALTPAEARLEMRKIPNPFDNWRDKVDGVSGGQSGLKKINSPTEFNALPSGAQFIAPDGSIRRKP